MKDRKRFTPPSRKGIKLPPFSKEHRDKLSKARIYTMAHNQKYFGTSIEIKMEQELTKRGVRFQKQYPIYQAKTIPDFFIAPNICIYCDGDYWHRKSGRPEKDAQQNFILNFLGYKVYRFWEKDIKKDISKCVDTITIG